MNCLPKQIDCAAGQSCPAGWSCFDFTNVNATVPGWSPDATGKSCFPDGLILAVQGHANGGGGVTYSGGGETKGGTPTVGIDNGQGGVPGTNTDPTRQTGTDTTLGTTGPTTTPPPVTPATPPTDTTATPESTGTPVTKVHGGGCALGGGHAASIDLWAALALAGLVVRVARRRRSDRQ
jgi:hypothetical protein